MNYRAATRPGMTLGMLILIVSLSDVQASTRAPLTVELPERPVSTLITGRTIYLNAGDDLQRALNQVESGDLIMLEAGAVFSGPFVLRNHGGTDWVTVTSTSTRTTSSGRTHMGASLPAAGVRIRPDDVPAMASLVSASGPVIRTDAAAARYHFIGIEVRQSHAGELTDMSAGTRSALTNLVELGAGNNHTDIMPHHIVFERCYLHGDAVLGTRRGIVFNGAHMAVIDSHLSGFKSREDAQAVAGWEGTGPFLIENNFLEASGENVMFGGADPRVVGRIPSDIVIRGNHFSKPLTWRETDPGYEQSNWSVKNLLELKNASHVLIDGNLFEYNWPQSQNGFAILFTVRNQQGKSPWSRVDNVTFSNNIVRHVAAGISILGYDDNHRSERTQGIRIINNLFHDIGDSWGNGRLLQLLNSPADIEIIHNTALQSDAIMQLEGMPIPGVTITNNIFMHNDPGISGTNTGPGQHSISTYLAEPLTIHGNLLIGPGDATYRHTMIRVPGINHLPFFDPLAGDFRLGPMTDLIPLSRDVIPGVDFSRLCQAMSASDRPAYC